MAAAGTTQRESAESLGPRVQSRVGRRLAGELRPGSLAQAVVVDGVRSAKLGDDREAVPLPRQHIAWQQAKALAAGPARCQGDLECLLDRHSLAMLITSEHHDRPTHPRTREPEGCPWHEEHRECDGMTSCPFTICAA